MAIKAVTFDLWFTLIWDSEELEDYRKLRRLANFHRFAKKYRDTSSFPKNRFGFNEVRLALEEVQLSVKRLYEQGFDVHPRDRGRMLFEFLKIKIPKNESKIVYEKAGRILSNSGYYKKYPHVNPEAKPTFKALKECYPEIKIALISNAARSAATYRRMLRSFGLDNYFDKLIISCEVGFLKPRREIFEFALSSLPVEPKDSLHVGDLYRADVVGAAAVGMNAALYTGLWDKYSDKELPIHDHLPSGYKAPAGLVVREIENLEETLTMVAELSKRR
ncbi:MAG: HAD family hydrolase [Nitrososphaerales archaeon]